MDRNDLRLRRRCRELGFHRLLVTPLFFLLAELFFRSLRYYSQYFLSQAQSLDERCMCKRRTIHAIESSVSMPPHTVPVFQAHLCRQSSSPSSASGLSSPFLPFLSPRASGFGCLTRLSGTFTLTLIRQITKCGEDFNLDYTL